jgi:hypothetical protein
VRTETITLEPRERAVAALATFAAVPRGKALPDRDD